MKLDKQFDMIKQDLLAAFAAAYKDLKPTNQPGFEEARLSDILHKLRTRCLALLHEARDA